jgi:predicted dehydrogenase
VAAGHREGLVFEIAGDTGSMRWCESDPGTLVLVANDGTKKTFTDKTAAGAIGGVDTPFVAGDAYVEALARGYCDFADSLAGCTKKSRSGENGRLLGMTIEEGVHSVAVSEAIIKSVTPASEGRPPVPKWVHVAEC